MANKQTEDDDMRAAARAGNVFFAESVRAYRDAWANFLNVLDNADQPEEVQQAFFVGWNNYFEGMARAARSAEKAYRKD